MDAAALHDLDKNLAILAQAAAQHAETLANHIDEDKEDRKETNRRLSAVEKFQWMLLGGFTLFVGFPAWGMFLHAIGFFGSR